MHEPEKGLGMIQWVTGEGCIWFEFWGAINCRVLGLRTRSSGVSITSVKPHG